MNDYTPGATIAASTQPGHPFGQPPVTPATPNPELGPNQPNTTSQYAPARMPLSRMVVPGVAIAATPAVGAQIINQREMGMFARSLIIINTSGSVLSLDSMQGWQIPGGVNSFIVRCAPAIGWVQISVAVSGALAGSLWIIATEEDLAPSAGGSSGGFTGGAATPQNQATGQLTTGAATQIGSTRTTRANMLIKNTDTANTIYIGTSNTVTSGNGFPLKPGESAAFTGPQIWTIAGAGTPVAAFYDSWF